MEIIVILGVIGAIWLVLSSSGQDYEKVPCSCGGTYGCWGCGGRGYVYERRR
jgi:hypothetical protein